MSMTDFYFKKTLPEISKFFRGFLIMLGLHKNYTYFMKELQLLDIGKVMAYSTDMY
jgi:hypothetical protein